MDAPRTPKPRAAAVCPDCAAAAAHLAAGEASDGYHTHNELYEYRMLYNAHAARGWLAEGHTVVKSWRHADGEVCFGGGWFIVTAELPTGQVSNHYQAAYWALFDVPEVERPPAWDGHTPTEAAARLRGALAEGGAVRSLIEAEALRDFADALNINPDHVVLRRDFESRLTVGDHLRAAGVAPGADTDHATRGAAPHRYLSTGCRHGDTVLSDGRTGHQYCQSDTGHAGSKRPARCKFCSAPCVCPCHTATEDHRS